MIRPVAYLCLALFLSACSADKNNDSGMIEGALPVSSPDRPQAPRPPDQTENSDLLLEFEYDLSEIEPLRIIGYRVYANGKKICESFNPYILYVTRAHCDEQALAELPRPALLTMTALANNGELQESAHSDIFMLN